MTTGQNGVDDRREGAQGQGKERGRPTRVPRRRGHSRRNSVSALGEGDKEREQHRTGDARRRRQRPSGFKQKHAGAGLLMKAPWIKAGIRLKRDLAGNGALARGGGGGGAQCEGSEAGSARERSMMHASRGRGGRGDEDDAVGAVSATDRGIRNRGKEGSKRASTLISGVLALRARSAACRRGGSVRQYHSVRL